MWQISIICYSSIKSPKIGPVGNQNLNKKNHRIIKFHILRLHL